MVRKREKFKKEREMPHLTTSAVVVITAVIAICFVLALFSAGLIQPYLAATTTSPFVPAINTVATAVSASTMFLDYSQSPTLAAINYTHQWVYVVGNVTSVQNSGGDYQSCVAPSEPYLYGCSYVAQMTGWIVWTWNGPSEASKVPIDVDFVAACYVVGLNIGELYLDSCSVA